MYTGAALIFQPPFPAVTRLPHTRPLRAPILVWHLAKQTNMGTQLANAIDLSQVNNQSRCSTVPLLPHAAPQTGLLTPNSAPW